MNKNFRKSKKSLTPDKYLYVIHNLQNFHKKEQVEEYIEKTLKKLFSVQIEEINFQNNINNFHKKYHSEVKNNKITHLIFVNDYSPIAQYYNEPTVSFLKKKLEVEQSRVEFSVVKKCKEFLIRIQPDFLEGAIESKDFSNEEEDKIVLKEGKEINLKKVFIDEIGKTIANYADEPNYYYYYTEGKEFIVCIEFPGKNAEIESRLERGDEFYLFDFKGKKPDYEDSNKAPRIKKNMNKGNVFNFSIRIPLKDLTIFPNSRGSLNWETKTPNEGIFTFKYRIDDGANTSEYE